MRKNAFELYFSFSLYFGFEFNFMYLFMDLFGQKDLIKKTHLWGSWRTQETYHNVLRIYEGCDLHKFACYAFSRLNSCMTMKMLGC